jgi:hypothetical protein
MFGMRRRELIALPLRNLFDRRVEPSRNNELTNVCNDGGCCDRKHPLCELRGALTICCCLSDLFA